MSFPTRRLGWVCRQCQLQLGRQTRNFATKKDKKQYLPSTPVRTRFAPSPTGYLHFGSLRTALYNYLLARRTKGQFILRLEDTDEKRTIPGAEERIYDDLRWAGLSWDEGPQIGGAYGPYRQSERLDLYRNSANTLIKNGSAYRCFCSAEDLRAKDELNIKKGWSTGYDRTCYHNVTPEQSEDCAAQGKPYVVRLLDKDEEIKGADFVYGKIPPAQKRIGFTYDDPILLKQSGGATYHLANVVDDHHMAITHVIRGVEWLISTRKHLALYKAFGWTPPEFAHVGLLLDAQGNKLSKRDLTFDLASLKRDGVLPEALNNFLVLLGWSHKEGKEFMDMAKLKNIFDLRFTKSNPVVSLHKLSFLSPWHAEKRVKNAMAAGLPSSLDLSTASAPNPAQSGEAIDRHAELVDLIQQAATRHYPASDLSTLGLNDPTRLRLQAARMLEDYYRNYSTAAEFVANAPYLFIQENPAKVSDLLIRPVVAKLLQTLQVDAEYVDAYLRAVLLGGLKNKAPEEWTMKTLEHDLKQLLSTQVAMLLDSLPRIEEDGEESERLLKTATSSLSAFLWQVLRGVLTWGMHGPSLASTMVMLGKTETIRRLENGKIRFVIEEPSQP